MGSFSWTKAERTTKTANIIYDKPFKFLIPAEFGGGFIKDNYQDYGYLGTNEFGEPMYDMFELLAFWNKEMFPEGTLQYDGDFPAMKTIDKYTDKNRDKGIDIGCYDNQIDVLKFPLKLVSVSYNRTYEECQGRSYGDPNQGWSPLSWDEV